MSSLKMTPNLKKLHERQSKKAEESDTKKTFDKKLYRLKKYSKKYKLEQWEEQRKKKMLQEYYKESRNYSTHGKYTKSNSNEEGDIGLFVRHPDLIKSEEMKVEESKPVRRNAVWKAKNHLEQVRKDKEEKRKQAEKAKEERKKAIEDYQKIKAEKFKKLSRKTRKGQPVMSGRLELLFEKIKSGKNN